MRKRLVSLGVFVLLSVFSAGVAFAEYPTRPVQFLIGWSIGGGSDQAGRALCMFAEKYFKEPFSIQNLPAGSGAKSYMTIAKADPDGYTIGSSTSTISTLKPMGTIPLGANDFEQIILFNSDPGGIWVHKDAPWKTLPEFLAHAKANPGKVSIAASNPGSITRFQMLALEKAGGVKFRVLSQSGGAAKGLTALAGKHVDAAMGTPLEGNALYASGNIRPLGFSSEERVPMLKDVPTWKEQGIDVALSTARTVMAPKGTPKEVVDALYNAFKQAVNDPEFRKSMESKGSNVHDLNPEQTREFLAKQDAQFRELIESAGLLKK